MQNEPDLTPGEGELETALRGLRPTAPRVDAVACAFEAGAASARRSIRMWRGVAALLAMTMGISFFASRRTAPPAVIVKAPTTEHYTIAMEPRDAAYLRLRERVLDQGLDALTVPIHSAPAKGEPIPRAGDINWRSS